MANEVQPPGIPGVQDRSPAGAASSAPTPSAQSKSPAGDARLTAEQRLVRLRELLSAIRIAVARIHGQHDEVIQLLQQTKDAEASVIVDLMNAAVAAMGETIKQVDGVIAGAGKDETVAQSYAEEARSHVKHGGELAKYAQAEVANPGASSRPPNWVAPVARDRQRERKLFVYVHGNAGEKLKIDGECTLKCNTINRVSSEELRRLQHRMRVVVVLPPSITKEQGPIYFATNEVAGV